MTMMGIITQEIVEQTPTGTKFLDRNGDMWVLTQFLDENEQPYLCNFTTGLLRRLPDAIQFLRDFA